MCNATKPRPLTRLILALDSLKFRLIASNTKCPDLATSEDFSIGPDGGGGGGGDCGSRMRREKRKKKNRDGVARSPLSELYGFILYILQRVHGRVCTRSFLPLIPLSSSEILCHWNACTLCSAFEEQQQQQQQQQRG
ncbi:hypothetical protein M0804_006198 [Polistes exclamans]|nr:hypothetical protein M0804_006198 [Polistes exclamans]